MEKSEVATEVVEELEGQALNKVVIVGAIVAGGTLVYLLVPKAVRKVKRLLTKKRKAKNDQLPAQDEAE